MVIITSCFQKVNAIWFECDCLISEYRHFVTDFKHLESQYISQKSTKIQLQIYKFGVHSEISIVARQSKWFFFQRYIPQKLVWGWVILVFVTWIYFGFRVKNSYI